MLDQQPIEQFLAALQAQKGFSGNTLAAYRNDLSQFAGFLSGGQTGGALARPVSSWAGVTRDSIISFLLYLKERQYAATTVARKQAALKSFFKYMAARGAVASNPVGDLASPHIDRALPHTINTSEVERLLYEMNHAHDSPEVLRDRAMMQLLYATGLRVGETVALNLGDVDSTSTDRNVEIRGLGSGKPRKIAIASGATLEALRDYLDTGRPALARLHGSMTEAIHNIDRNDMQALFLNHRGQRLTRQGFWLILKRYAKLAGLGEITPHTLRHSFAAQKLNSGTDMRDLQQILGHANISTTQVYARIGQKQERKKGRSSAPAKAKPAAATKPARRNKKAAS